MTPATSRVADFVVDHLAANGTTHVFGVGGANIEDMYDAIERHPSVTGILAKHEFSAATMAEGYSRAGNNLGVVVTTSGGACLNVVAALGEAFTSRVPVLAIVGQPPRILNGRGSFQDTSGQNGSIDAEAVFSAVSVYCRRVERADDVAGALSQAIAEAIHAGGPAVLLLPKDIQQAPTTAAATLVAASAPAPQPADARLIAHAIGPGAVTIIAGPQVGLDDARVELESLRTRLQAHVVTTPDAKDANSGIGVTGVMGHPHIADTIASSSTCLLIGTRLPGTAGAGLDTALAGVQTVSIGSEKPYPDTVHFHSDDLRSTLAGLARVVETGESRSRRERVHTEELQPPAYDGAGIRYRDAMAVLDDLVADGADIVVDAGNTGASAIHHLPTRRDGRFVVALGMGGMGYSFGAAIGIAFARGRRTVVIAGDGAFFMHGMEIHTAIQYRLPITFVLFNNDAHAMCVTREQIYYGGDYTYNRFTPSALGAGLGAMFPGLHSVDVDDIDDLRSALQSAFDASGPSVVSIRCAADEIPPFAPFLQALKTENSDTQEDPTPNRREDSADVVART